MLDLSKDSQRKQRAFQRRDVLQIGGLSALGLTSADLSQLRAEPVNDVSTAKRRQNSCVFLFLFGGPSQIDLWDMKPKAAAEVRGEFQPVATIGLMPSRRYWLAVACAADRFMAARIDTQDL